MASELAAKTEAWLELHPLERFTVNSWTPGEVICTLCHCVVTFAPNNQTVSKREVVEYVKQAHAEWHRMLLDYLRELWDAPSDASDS